MTPLADSDQLKAQLEQLCRMSASQLASFEKSIVSDFRNLASRYVSARLVRAKALRDLLEKLIEASNANDKAWRRIVAFELETIATLSLNAENLIKLHPNLLPSLRDYDDEIAAVCQNLHGPLDCDKSISCETNENNMIPFHDRINYFLEPHVAQLRAVSASRRYCANSITKTARVNAGIAWKQYHSDVISEKQSLIDETEAKIRQLDKEFAPYGFHRSRSKVLLVAARRKIALRQKRLYLLSNQNVVLGQVFASRPSEAESDVLALQKELPPCDPAKDLLHKLQGGDTSGIPSNDDRGTTLDEAESMASDGSNSEAAGAAMLDADCLDQHVRSDTESEGGLDEEAVYDDDDDDDDDDDEDDDEEDDEDDIHLEERDDDEIDTKDIDGTAVEADDPRSRYVRMMKSVSQKRSFILPKIPRISDSA